MPEGGHRTPIAPGVIARLTQAARYVVSGVSPSTWFGPQQPLAPIAPPDTAGRRFDYPTGYNLNYTPRSYEGVSFGDLRALADNCDILRTVIETRKDQIEAMEWTIRLRPDGTKRQTPTPDQQARIDAVTQFFQSPDQVNGWSHWLRQMLEDMFVLDAVALYKRPTRGGDLYALEIVDGATIKPILDAGGRSPLPPDPAYQQVLKGVPAVDYTRDELLYLQRNPRSNRVYGCSPVEQVLVTVNILIRRALHQLEYYREGSDPDAFVGLPKEWTQQQIGDFQRYFDALMSGNSGQRRRLRFMPGDFSYKATKEPLLKDAYDEWLARVICFAFSVAPEPFVQHVNRATAETAHDRATEEGLAPLLRWLKLQLTGVIARDFASPDLIFDWLDDREQDPKTASDIAVAQVKAGIISIDEARDMKGMDALGGAYAVPMLATATGYVVPGAVPAAPEEDEAPITDESDNAEKLLAAGAVKKKTRTQNLYFSMMTPHTHD